MNIDMIMGKLKNGVIILLCIYLIYYVFSIGIIPEISYFDGVESLSKMLNLYDMLWM